jgi:predicted SAM-dependent methyltransferase
MEAQPKVTNPTTIRRMNRRSPEPQPRPPVKLKLHIGCGNIYFPGWVNIDISAPKADQKIDIRRGFPFGEGTVSHIYCEHFIEHLDQQEGYNFIKECFRVLAPAGVLRLATFDLDQVLIDCRPDNPNWKKDSFAVELGLGHIQTRAEHLNTGFHAWGHKYLYNYEEFERLLKVGGFTNYKKCKIYESDHDELKNRESRFNSHLIIEGIR